VSDILSQEGWEERILEIEEKFTQKLEYEHVASGDRSYNIAVMLQK
jgi:hypothetical protein